ncbi:MAG TPA: purine permease [Candidatus Flavonifractor merdipullorum]|uniref:Purine permease n=1 Tax=Candidatus Flavonifractor merdipullorum TaxID=2838590 RepID=A0A9D1UND9_9FIRM|nr:purine permease [Candidatus Flavonifractor merdipullorum]
MKQAAPFKRATVFQYEGVPPLGQMVPLGLQHVVAAVVGIVTPAIMIAGSCGITGADQTLLIQVSLLVTAVATLIQLFPIGPIGSRLPVIMGISFAYVPTLQAIGQQFGLPEILGAEIIGGIVAILFGIFVKQIRVLFPPLVTGTVIFTIGLSLYPTAIKYMAGGVGKPDYASPKSWLVAIITFLVVLILQNFGKGVLKLGAILWGIIVGYVISIPLGLVEFSAVGQAGLFQVPTPMHFEIAFEPSAIVSLAIVYMVNAVQTIGDLSSTTIGGMDRMPTDKELRGGIVGQGVMSVVGALFGGLPTASYSQNVGIITVNRVINRAVFVFAAVVLAVAGFVPKIASILTTIPQSVIGGATVSVFAMITMTGVSMITSERFDMRARTVVGLSVALGVGISQVQGCLAGFPEWVTMVFGSSPVVVTAIMAIFLNLILPKPNPESV